MNICVDNPILTYGGSFVGKVLSCNLCAPGMTNPFNFLSQHDDWFWFASTQAFMKPIESSLSYGLCSAVETVA